MIRHTVPTPPPSPLWGEGRVRGPVVRGPVVRGPVVRGGVVEGTVAAGTSSVNTAPPGPDPFSARRSIFLTLTGAAAPPGGFVLRLASGLHAKVTAGGSVIPGANSDFLLPSGTKAAQVAWGELKPDRADE